jgi:hypothetical protein
MPPGAVKKELQADGHEAAAAHVTVADRS